MTRGNFILIIEENDDTKYYKSTQFNGNMFPYDEGYGVDFLKTYTADNIHSLEEWKKYVEKFNDKYFHYNDELLYWEVTEENRKICINNWNCYTCIKRDCCYIEMEFEGVDNLFDITTYNYHSDYTYWLNLTEVDIEIKASNGIVQINSHGGAVFHYDDFYETSWDSGFIDPKDSYDFRDDEDIKIKILMDKWKKYNLDVNEAEEMIENDHEKKEIINVYDSLEEFGKELIFEYCEVNIPQWLEDFINYESYAVYVMEKDYGYFLESISGRIIRFSSY